MIEKLSKLYNTLSLINTKGNDTKLMGQCLQYLENMIAEEQNNQSIQNEAPEVATE